MIARVLVAIRDTKLRSRVGRLLKSEDIVLSVLDPQDVTWDALANYPTDVLVVSRTVMPADCDNHIARLVDAPNAPAVVVLTERDDAEEHARLRGAGAEAILHGKVPEYMLQSALQSIVAARRDFLDKALAARRAMAQPRLADFVSTSESMQVFMKTVYRVVDSDAPLLVTGETGVGKERLARAVHGASRRSDSPFISVNCGAIPEHLLESQLFGHEKGAFTGATRTQRGCFELAHGGVLFLDEITELPFHLQVKLLHVLQDFEVRPLGSERAIPVDVRIIAATNRDIAEEVQEKRFRQDLFYRLGVVALQVPPLRERKGDIPLLAESFIADLSARIGRSVRAIAPESMQMLVHYAWPGNVRELINVLERAILLCEDNEITPTDLPEEIAGSQVAAPPFLPDEDGSAMRISDAWMSRPLRDIRENAVARVEKAYLTRLLEETHGRIAITAERAGIEPRSLFTKMKKYGLRKEDFKSRRPSRQNRT